MALSVIIPLASCISIPCDSVPLCTRLQAVFVSFVTVTPHFACYERLVHVYRDRQPFAWEKQADGVTLNFTPAMLTIHRNFFFANYGAGQAVDNDDGSSYYDIHHNVQYAAGGLKSDYAGHDKLYHHNLNVGGGGCGMYNYYQNGHADQCFNNTFILGGPVLRLFPPCALISHAQGSSGVVENMPFVRRGHTKSLTTRARPSPDLAVWLE